MILSNSKTMMVDGVTTDVTPLCKNDQGKISHAEFRVANGAGGVVKPRTVYLYDEVACCVLQQIELLSSVTYNISGICAPGSRTVYLSYLPNRLGGRALKNNLIAQTEANSDGEYCFSGLTNINGSCILWANMPSDYLKSSTITYEIESLTDTSSDLLLTNTYVSTVDGYCTCFVCNGEKIVHEGDNCRNCGGDGVMNNVTACTECDGDGAVNDGSTCHACGGDGYIDEPCTYCGGIGIVQATTTCPKCNGTGRVYDDYFAEPYRTISGKCPLDSSSVYVSEYIPSDLTDFETCAGLTAAILSESVIAVCSPENGEYSIEFRSYADVKYVLWCTSHSGGTLTIDDVITEEADSVCLSGDTMISITCNYRKRLDELQAGDMVMSEDGSLTKVLETRNGFFNNYHTLYTFNDGTVIDETHDHRFFNHDQGFWQVLKNWHIGDRAIKINGEMVSLVSIKRVDENAEMFGLWTESGSYYANGLLSGVASCNKTLLSDATAEKAIDMLLSVNESKLLQLMGLDGVLP